MYDIYAHELLLIQLSSSISDFQEWTDSDKVFSGIFSTCIAAGSACPLNTQNVTAAQLERSTWDLLDSLKQNPIVLGNVLLDYSALKGVIQAAIYGPSAWPNLAVLLNALLNGVVTEVDASVNALGAAADVQDQIDSSIALTTAISAIHCSDAKLRVTTFNEYRPALEQMYSTSSIMGDASHLVRMRCAQWKIAPKERYEGGFTVQTKNPVLFIGNTWDGHTPLASAYNVSSGFNGSVVLEVNGYGVSGFCFLHSLTPSIASETLRIHLWLTF